MIVKRNTSQTRIIDTGWKGSLAPVAQAFSTELLLAGHAYRVGSALARSCQLTAKREGGTCRQVLYGDSWDFTVS